MTTDAKIREAEATAFLEALYAFWTVRLRTLESCGLDREDSAGVDYVVRVRDVPALPAWRA